MIRSYMPEQHRAFYESLECVFVCVRDEEGRPRAMALTGRAGFIASPTPTELTINLQHCDAGLGPMKTFQNSLEDQTTYCIWYAMQSSHGRDM